MLAVCWQSVLWAGGGVGRQCVLWAGAVVCISMGVLRAGSCVPALCSTGWWLWACSMFHGQAVMRTQCVLWMFYGLAVVCLQCVLWVGGGVDAVFSMSILRAGGCVPAVCSAGW